MSSDQLVALLTEKASAATASSEFSTAHALYFSAHAISGVTSHGVSAANSLYKDGQANDAQLWYEAMLESDMLAPSVRQTVNRKLADIAKGTPAVGGRAIGSPQTTITVLGADASKSPSKGTKKLLELLTTAGATANSSDDDAYTAWAHFAACYALGGGANARISMANMLLRLGRPAEARGEYEGMLTYMGGGTLSPKNEELVRRKLDEAVAASGGSSSSTPTPSTPPRASAADATPQPTPPPPPPPNDEEALMIKMLNSLGREAAADAAKEALSASEMDAVMLRLLNSLGREAAADAAKEAMAGEAADAVMHRLLNSLGKEAAADAAREAMGETAADSVMQKMLNSLGREAAADAAKEAMAGEAADAVMHRLLNSLGKEAAADAAREATSATEMEAAMAKMLNSLGREAAAEAAKEAKAAVAAIRQAAAPEQALSPTAAVDAVVAAMDAAAPAAAEAEAVKAADEAEMRREYVETLRVVRQASKSSSLLAEVAEAIVESQEADEAEMRREHVKTLMVVRQASKASDLVVEVTKAALAEQEHGASSAGGADGGGVEGASVEDATPTQAEAAVLESAKAKTAAKWARAGMNTAAGAAAKAKAEVEAAKTEAAAKEAAAQSAARAASTLGKWSRAGADAARQAALAEAAEARAALAAAEASLQTLMSASSPSSAPAGAAAMVGGEEEPDWLMEAATLVSPSAANSPPGAPTTVTAPTAAQVPTGAPLSPALDAYGLPLKPAALARKPTAFALPLDEALPEDAATLRLAVVGESGAGKTALLRRFLHGRFEPSSTASTIAVDVSTVGVALGDALKVSVQLYDTAGQERFAPLTAPYYRQADGVIVVFDPASRQSYERALGFWANEVAKHARDDAVVLLVGTKADALAAAPAIRRVRADEAEAAATARGWLYCLETSAATGDSVGDAFYLLACAVMNARAEAGGKASLDGEGAAATGSVALSGPRAGMLSKACAC